MTKIEKLLSFDEEILDGCMSELLVFNNGYYNLDNEKEYSFILNGEVLLDEMDGLVLYYRHYKYNDNLYTLENYFEEEGFSKEDELGAVIDYIEEDDRFSNIELSLGKGGRIWVDELKLELFELEMVVIYFKELYRVESGNEPDNAVDIVLSWCSEESAESNDEYVDIEKVDVLDGSTNVKYGDLNKDQKLIFDKYFEKVIEEIESTANGKKINVDAVKTYCLKNFKDPNLVFYNNIKDSEMEVSLLGLLKILRFSKSPPIITAFNTLFHNGNRVKNLPGVFLNYLLSERKKVKSEMFKYINTDPAKYGQLDLLQRIIKILANSYYGAFGSKSFIFFNPDIGPSITYQGQQIIITAILGFEGFAGNNVIIEDFSQYMNYINNILHEEMTTDYVLDKTITPEDVLSVTDRFLEFDMSDLQRQIILEKISECSQSRLQKLYFTNNLFEFLRLPEIEDRIVNEMVIDNYLEADRVPDEIKEPISWLTNLVRNFVFYIYPHENKTDKATRMKRKAVLLSDTDSTFVNARPFIDRVCKRLEIDKSELTNKERCSIVSIFTKLITDYIADTYYNFTTNANVLEEDKHRVGMKSEFHYKRLMLTPNKKSYAGIVLSKEGKVYDVPDFDIKGLQIRKVSTPKVIRTKFADILEKDILNAPEIKFKDIYRKFYDIEKGIRTQIADHQCSVMKPQAIKSMTNYKDAISQIGYRGAMIWNYLNPRETITDFTSVYMIKFKENYTLETIKGLIPEDLYEKLLDLPDYLAEINPNKRKKDGDTRDQYERFGIDCIAIPWMYEQFPEYVDKLIFSDKIVNDMIKSGNVLLESIGFTIVKNNRTRDGFESMNASNIVKF